MRLVELSRREHGGLRIRDDLVEATAASQHLIPVVVSEFRKAATQYPIVFAKNPETGRFNSYVLTGLGVKENLFWSGTELDVTYVPLNVRRQPFYVGMNDAPGGADGGGANVLCIDLDSACLGPSGKETLLNPDGTDSAYLKRILSILNELVAGKAATEEFIATLLSLRLLAPVLLDISLDDGTPLTLTGLYSIDEEKFRELDERDIAQLWKAGHLDLIYSVLLGGGQMFKLIRMRNQRTASSRAWHSNAS
jgi:hypothetical protein